MQLEETLAKLRPRKDVLLTIGVFDGVHLGHKYLISQLTEQARKQNLLSGVITFDQHPREVLSPQTRLPCLTSLTEKINLLKSEGVDIVVTLPFTKELAGLSAERFVGLLKKYLRIKGLVIGPDFALGYGREGNVDRLRKLGQKADFTVMIVPPVVIADEVVSSTAIRNALARGDMKRVRSLAGRPFSLERPVTTGVRRGTKLGFPTANLDVDSEQALPADGVYATLAHINGKTYQAVTNIGKRPTFDDGERTVEVHVMDYQGDLYGSRLRIDFLERLRDEKKFNTTQELKEQIAKDIRESKTVSRFLR